MRDEPSAREGCCLERECNKWVKRRERATTKRGGSNNPMVVTRHRGQNTHTRWSPTTIMVGPLTLKTSPELQTPLQITRLPMHYIRDFSVSPFLRNVKHDRQQISLEA